MDLDFLVDRVSYQPALSILSGLGFKPAVVRGGNNSPGISHYYGYDPVTDRFAHVHLFSRVLTGESFLKSHLLPFEPMLLQNVRYDGQMRVASKPAELILFITRTYIKYGSLLDLVYLSKKTGKIKSELRWLKEGADLGKTLCLLKQYCPVIDEDLFLECINTLEGDASLIRRVGLARKVRNRLRIYARHTFLERVYGYFHLVLSKALRRLGSSKKDKVLQKGGVVIAIVGADATGKSTLVAETGRWLGENFAVRIVHAGKPPTSWVTAPFNLLFHLVRRFWPKSLTTNHENRNSSEKKEGSRNSKGWAGLLYAFRAVALAWDRRNLLLKGWRAAANGEIVVCDRYPSNIVGAMDSPRLKEIKEDSGWLGNVYNKAAGLEQQLYAQIPPPDLVVRLRVSVETAKDRNRLRDKPGDEKDEYIESRHRLYREWRRSDTGKVFDVDTEQSLAETTLQLKDILWRAL